METQDQNYVGIILTDIQLHTNKMERSAPFSKLVSKSVKNNKPGRMYTRGISCAKDGKITLPLFPNSEIQKIIDKYAKLGKKVKFFIRKSGLPILPGKDTLEFLEARKKRAFDKAGN